MMNKCVIEFKGDKDFALHVSETLTKNNPSKEDVICYTQILGEEMDRIIESGSNEINTEYTLRLSLSLAIHNWAMVKGYFSVDKRGYKH